MDRLSDDDIELLKTSPSENSGNLNPGLDEVDSLNPLHLLSRSSTEDSLISAPIHALQTAFTSLQQKHNQQTKKYNEVVQENKLMKRWMQDYKGSANVNGNIIGDMDEILTSGLDPSMAMAAGGTSEDDTLAERRANEGLIRHLQKEVLLRDNELTKTREENYRLKYGNDELQKELHKHLIEKDRVISDKEALMQSLSQLKLECDKRDSEVRHLKESLHFEKQTSDSHRQENNMLKQKLDQLDQGIQTISKEKQALEAKCKQFEIQSKINSENNQSLRIQDEQDDVDGDLMTLKNALDLVEHQKQEYFELKHKVKQQAAIIKQLTGFKGQVRDEAQGASFHGNFNEEPTYGNMNTSGYYTGTNSSQIKSTGPNSSISRRQSDRSNYRAAHTSPRVDDTVMPTGTQNITRMVAQGIEQPMVRRESANVVDSRGSPVSPRQVREGELPEPNYRNISQYSNTPISSPRVQHSAADMRYVPLTTVVGNNINVGAANVCDSVSIAPREQTSPYSRVGNKTLESESANIYNGARPRTQTSATTALDLENSDMRSPRSPRNQLPHRMTQSEVFTRDRSPNEGTSAMTRSVLDPLKPLDIPTLPNPHNRSDNDGYVQVVVNQQRLQTPPPRRESPTREETYSQQENIGPDYENVYNARLQTEIKRPLDEHEDNTFLTCRGDDNRPNLMQTETSDNVAALKICPVCNLEYSRMPMEQFQMHVFECFDNSDEAPATLQAVQAETDDDRVCPMCGDTFPLTIPQETYEQHVLAHFGDDPQADRFEIVHP